MVEPNKIIPEIVNRRSVREYKSIPVEWEKIERILEAGRLAPTAKNRQEWKVLIVNDKIVIQKMVSACADQTFIGSAPILLVAISTDDSYTMRCGIKAGNVDTSLVLENIALQAVKEGLGTCYIGAFYQKPVKELLSIPKDKTVIQILTLGYPNDKAQPRIRKDLKNFYSLNSYEE